MPSEPKPWTEEEERDIEMSAEARRRAAKKIREDVAAETEAAEKARKEKEPNKKKGVFANL